MKKRFIAIKNQLDDNTLELYFLDVIQDTYDFWTDSTISQVAQIIEKVNYYQPSKIKCIIDSIGGDAQIGITIYNFLKNYNAKIEVDIIGLAGSIASVVAMAANKGKLRIARNGFMMIHKAQGITMGTADELRQAGDLIEKYDAQIADIYAARTGKPVADITALYANGDYWMDGTEAVAQGFADETFNDVQNIQVAARLDGENLTNIPQKIRAQMETKPPENIQTFFKQQMDDMKNFFSSIVNSIKGVKPAENTTNITGEQLAAAIEQPFEEVTGKIENQIKETVKEELKTVDVSNAAKTFVESEAGMAIINTAIQTAVDAMKKTYDERFTALEAAKEDLEKDITNMKGKETKTTTEGDVVTPVGAFKK
jgi:ATP-dependent Clp protease protease subunit